MSHIHVVWRVSWIHPQICGRLDNICIICRGFMQRLLQVYRFRSTQISRYQPMLIRQTRSALVNSTSGVELSSTKFSHCSCIVHSLPRHSE